MKTVDRIKSTWKNMPMWAKVADVALAACAVYTCVSLTKKIIRKK